MEISRASFGFTKDGFKYLLDLVLQDLMQSEVRSRASLTPVLKLAIFLDFLRTNTFHRVIGTQHHNRVSQGTATVVINQVSKIIAKLHNQVHI